MGKFLESLRHASTRPASTEAPKLRNVTSPAAEVDITGEEIPFIEVGPHKSMEASASVLATRPLAAVTAPAATFHSSPVEITPRRPHFAPEVIAHHQPDHATSAQYRDLLAALTPAASGEGAQTLFFAPGLPGVDAAVVLLNLAVTAARPGDKRIIVVDGGAPHQALANHLGLAGRPGFGDVLCGRVALEQALQPTDFAHLTLLAAGAPPGTGLRLIVETPHSVFRKLRQLCDLLLVLGPAWQDGGEALATACDVVYLVLPEREAGSPCVDELLQTFPLQRTHFGGCILAAS
jgi:hypothetical protein